MEYALDAAGKNRELATPLSTVYHLQKFLNPNGCAIIENGTRIRECFITSHHIRHWLADQLLNSGEYFNLIFNNRIKGENWLSATAEEFKYWKLLAVLLKNFSK